MKNLTRKQEVILIDLGMRWLLENLQLNPKLLGVKHAQPVTKRKVKSTKAKPINKKLWTPERRAKFIATMAAKKKVAKKMGKTWVKDKK